MGWKKWPYWLKGGVIGGGVALAFVAVWYGCALYGDSTGRPGEIGNAFLCLSVFFLTPASFPTMQLMNFVGQGVSIAPVTLIELIFLYAPIVNILVWFLLGGFIGSIVGHYRVKEKSPPV